MTNSLERALALLELLERTPGGMKNAEISRRLGMATSTCSYITYRLERSGYLRRDPETRHYLIGLKTVALARGALRELGFRSMAEPVLYRMVIETGLSAGIGVRQEDHVLLVDRVEGSDAIQDFIGNKAAGPSRGRARDQRDIGRQLGLHSTALGKVLLAHTPRKELEEWLGQQTLERFTANTITDAKQLLMELEQVGVLGYATSDEEHYVGLRALAAPIFAGSRFLRAAISLNGSVHARAWDDMPALVKWLEMAAREISKALRFS